MPLDFANPNAKQREVLGTCPRCGRNIYEGEKNYFCESGRDGCGYTVWKNDKFIEDSITAEHMKNLLSGKSVKLRAKSKEPKILH
jgi:DNA topoisomerase-3